MSEMTIIFPKMVNYFQGHYCTFRKILITFATRKILPVRCVPCASFEVLFKRFA